MHQKDLLQGETQGGLGTSRAAFRAPMGGGTRARPLRLPPHTSLEKFHDFVIKVEEVVGNDNVTIISDQDELSLENYLEPSKAHDVGAIPQTTHMTLVGNTDRDNPDVLCCGERLFCQFCCRCAA